MKDLIIIGASGFGREVAWLVERINKAAEASGEHEWNLLGFIDDNPELEGKTVGGYPVLGGAACVSKYPDAMCVCAVGAAKTRKLIVEKPEFKNTRFATLIDPKVEISDRVAIGEGTIICAGTIVTVDISIGRHVIINLDCTIGHDAVLDDYVTLYPSVNVSGATHLSTCVELGTGAQIIQGKSVGEYAIVGAGAVIVRDIPAKCTAVGSPAKPIKFFE